MNRLKSVYIEITSKCNMNCPYCYNNSSKNGKFLNKSLIFKIIDECRTNDIREITISGGEPFLHPDIFSVIKYANSKKIRVRIISNLTMISIEEAIEILKHGNYLQLTIDSTDQEVNDSLRGEGTFTKTLQLLKNAKIEELSKFIVLRMNVSKINIDQIRPFVDMSIKYGIKHVSISFIASCGRGKNYKHAFNYDTSLNQMIEIMQYLKDLAKDLKDTIDIAYNNLEEQRGCPLFKKEDVDVNPRIDSDGNVFFCSYFFGERNSIGNVKKNNLLNIINSQEFYSFKKAVHQRKDNKKCDKCVFNKVCFCGCPAISYMNTGNIMDIDTQCKMIKFFMKNKVKQNKGLV